MDRYHPFLIVSSIRRVCSSPSIHPAPSWLQRISPIHPDCHSNKISPPRIARHKNSGYHCKRPPSNFQPLKYYFDHNTKERVIENIIPDERKFGIDLHKIIKRHFMSKLTASLSAVMFPGWILRRFNSVKRA
jgi:hypothetical protein